MYSSYAVGRECGVNMIINIPTEKLPKGKADKDRFISYIGSGFSDDYLLSQYENAVNVLINHLINSKDPVDLISNPLLYLMRHSLELGFKENIRYLSEFSKMNGSKKFSHDLEDLQQEFKKHFDSICSLFPVDKIIIADFTKFYNKTNKLINLLGKKEASTFRYFADRKGKPVQPYNAKRNILQMKRYYDKSIVLLNHTVNVLTPYFNYLELVKTVPNFKNGTGYVPAKFMSFQQKDYIRYLDSKYQQVQELIWLIDSKKYHLITTKKYCYLAELK